MKKVLAFVIAVFMLAAMAVPAFAAPTYIGEITIAMEGYADLEITLSNAGAKYGNKIESMYGTYNIIVCEPDSTVTFSKTVSLGNMGQDGGKAEAGVAVNISSIDGYYVYSDDASFYTIFATPNAMSYTEDMIVDDITAIKVASAVAEEPAEEPADEPADEPVPVVEPEPVAEPEPVVEPEPVAEPEPVHEAAAPAPVAYSTPAELTAAGAFELGTWPLAAGMYDPNLDTAGIPSGAYVYGLYSFDMTTFVGENFDFPAALAGYTKVASTSELKAGTYTEAVIGGFNYIVLLPAAGTAPATSDMTNVAPLAIICAIAVIGFAFAVPRRSKEK